MQAFDGELLGVTRETRRVVVLWLFSGVHRPRGVICWAATGAWAVRRGPGELQGARGWRWLGEQQLHVSSVITVSASQEAMKPAFLGDIEFRREFQKKKSPTPE